MADGAIRGRRALARRSMPATLAEDLRARILSGELAEGDKLRQELLAAEYDVSRMPVREALRQLEAEGLISFRSHKGAVVTALSPEDIEEVFELRRLIEVNLLRRAIPRLGEADLAAARRFAEAFDAALGAGGQDVAELGNINWKLHAALYAPAGRARSMRFLQTLHYQAERCVRQHVLLAGGQRRASAEHRRLIELCSERKTEEAAAMLTAHIEQAGRDLAGLLRERGYRSRMDRQGERS